jgi:hypothetical protein
MGYILKYAEKTDDRQVFFIRMTAAINLKINPIRHRFRYIGPIGALKLLPVFLKFEGYFLDGGEKVCYTL